VHFLAKVWPKILIDFNPYPRTNP